MTRNVAASVRARLTNKARATNRPFQEVLQHYGLERFLYRLAQTQHSSQFLLKGALLLTAWGVPASRPTRDIDLLGFVPNQIPILEQIVREVCTVAVQVDGLKFEPSTVVGRRIKEDDEYHGLRVTLTAFLERAQIPIQIDVGFGDVVHPATEERNYPTLLDFPAPRLRMYPRETVIAEKFEAMVQLGSVNSRMKDFFDVWLLSRQFDFSGPDLARSFERTFANRGTPLEAEPIALTPAFTASDPASKQWDAFVRRSRLAPAPATLDQAREPLRSFLLPVANALLEGRKFAERWVPPGPWKLEPREALDPSARS